MNYSLRRKENHFKSSEVRRLRPPACSLSRTCLHRSSDFQLRKCCKSRPITRRYRPSQKKGAFPCPGMPEKARKNTGLSHTSNPQSIGPSTSRGQEPLLKKIWADVKAASWRGDTFPSEMELIGEKHGGESQKMATPCMFHERGKGKWSGRGRTGARKLHPALNRNRKGTWRTLSRIDRNSTWPRQCGKSLSPEGATGFTGPWSGALRKG